MAQPHERRTVVKSNGPSRKDWGRGALNAPRRAGSRHL